ncbi:MAG TPA: DNA cytosine methyltransferase, partial [Burkholderiales bacterium]
YGFAYRVLDAQFWGVAQRRRRVFVVAHLGAAWQRAAAVLFERTSLRWSAPSGGQPREDIAGTIGGASQEGGFRTTDLDNIGALIPISEVGARDSDWNDDPKTSSGIGDGGDPMFTLQATKQHGVAMLFNAEGSEGATLTSSNGAKTLNNQTPLVAFKASHFTRGKDGAPSEVAPPLSADADRGDQDLLVATDVVRRLTPREWERLQGFPDDWTLIPWRGRPASECPDTPRYKALGNSMPVPVIRWLGERIAAVDAL